MRCIALSFWNLADHAVRIHYGQNYNQNLYGIVPEYQNNYSFHLRTELSFSVSLFFSIRVTALLAVISTGLMVIIVSSSLFSFTFISVIAMRTFVPIPIGFILKLMHLIATALPLFFLGRRRTCYFFDCWRLSLLLGLILQVGWLSCIFWCLNFLLLLFGFVKNWLDLNLSLWSRGALLFRHNSYYKFKVVVNYFQSLYRSR